MANLSGVDLGKADLFRAHLFKANLFRADLRFTDLCEADLSEAHLFRTDLREADLRSANLRNADLREADLSRADLSEAHLSGADLTKAFLKGANLSFALIGKVNFSGAILYRANLGGTELNHANFHKADLSEANLRNTLLYEADLSEANLRGADLGYAILTRANLSGADLSGADLMGANLMNATLIRANLTGCLIYGISAWDVQLKDAIQSSLIITLVGEPAITVDNLKVAQFIYLLLNNQEIRDVIDTITSKVVLILGRFTSERKAVLDTIRDELRKRNYSPIVFDFEKPANRDLTETVSTLAHLARFIIVDLTDPSSVPHEVATIIPQCIVPVQPLLLRDDAEPRHEYAMFHDLRTRYHWVLPTYQYKDIAGLPASFKENVIVPAEQKAQELAKR